MDTIHASKYLEVFPRGPLLAARGVLHQVPAVRTDVLDRRYHVKPTFKKKKKELSEAKISVHNSIEWKQSSQT